MATMTTRDIATNTARLNKDVMKYARRHNYKYKVATYKAKNNRTAKEYILSSKDATKIANAMNKISGKVKVTTATAPKVKAPKVKTRKIEFETNTITTEVKESTRKIEFVETKTAPASIVIAEDKKDKFLAIYAKYALNSKDIRQVVLNNLFKEAKPTGLTPDDAFEMLVDTIDAFSLHESISGFTYNLANSKVPKFKRKERSYHNFLKSLYWSIVRNKHLQDHPVCAICGTTHKLQIHHPDYKKIPRGTEYMHMNMLTTICDGCHKKVHNK